MVTGVFCSFFLVATTPCNAYNIIFEAHTSFNIAQSGNNVYRLEANVHFIILHPERK